MERLLRVLAALVTGPIMILAVLAAIPLVLLVVALGGVVAAFFCWSLWWGFIWLIGADPDAGKYFLQAVGFTMLPTTAIVLIVWALMGIKDWLLPAYRPPAMIEAPPPPPDAVSVPPPANDVRPLRLVSSNG